MGGDFGEILIQSQDTGGWPFGPHRQCWKALPAWNCGSESHSLQDIPGLGDKPVGFHPAESQPETVTAPAMKKPAAPKTTSKQAPQPANLFEAAMRQVEEKIAAKSKG